MWGIISTWRMSLEGLEKAAEILKTGGSAGDAAETAVREVESTPYYKSVGLGGLPNKEGEVELDAGFMDGDTLEIGAVMGMKGFLHPVSVARMLSKENRNNCLAGSGAEQYAEMHGFERANLRTDASWKLYEERLKKSAEEGLSAYQGHDTVGVAVLDREGHMAAGTSTSGLFFKHRGRIGDSPMPGNGYYCDSETGAAVATGVGEDIMKGCICYDIVSRMKQGKDPQAACDEAVRDLVLRLKKAGRKAGDISVLAMDKEGRIGVSSNLREFSFAFAGQMQEPCVFLADPGQRTPYHPASGEWLDWYMTTCMGGGLV